MAASAKNTRLTKNQIMHMQMVFFMHKCVEVNDKNSQKVGKSAIKQPIWQKVPKIPDYAKINLPATGHIKVSIMQMVFFMQKCVEIINSIMHIIRQEAFMFSIFFLLFHQIQYDYRGSILCQQIIEMFSCNKNVLFYALNMVDFGFISYSS